MNFEFPLFAPFFNKPAESKDNKLFGFGYCLDGSAFEIDWKAKKVTINDQKWKSWFWKDNFCWFLVVLDNPETYYFQLVFKDHSKKTKHPVWLNLTLMDLDTVPKSGFSLQHIEKTILQPLLFYAQLYVSFNNHPFAYTEIKVVKHNPQVKFWNSSSAQLKDIFYCCFLLHVTCFIQLKLNDPKLVEKWDKLSPSRLHKRFIDKICFQLTQNEGDEASLEKAILSYAPPKNEMVLKREKEGDISLGKIFDDEVASVAEEEINEEKKNSESQSETSSENPSEVGSETDAEIIPAEDNEIIEEEGAVIKEQMQQDMDQDTIDAPQEPEVSVEVETIEEKDCKACKVDEEIKLPVFTDEVKLLTYDKPAEKEEVAQNITDVVVDNLTEAVEGSALSCAISENSKMECDGNVCKIPETPVTVECYFQSTPINIQEAINWLNSRPNFPYQNELLEQLHKPTLDVAQISDLVSKVIQKVAASSSKMKEYLINYIKDEIRLDQILSKLEKINNVNVEKMN